MIGDTIRPVSEVVPLHIALRIYGGLDAHSAGVRECEKEHGDKHFWVEMLVDAHPMPQEVQFCRRCFVPRCAHLVENDRCIYPTLHSRAHRDERGRWRPVEPVEVVHPG